VEKQKSNSKKNLQKIVVSIILALLSFVFIFLITGLVKPISQFLYGVFGLSVYALLIAGIFCCVFTLLGKKITIKYRYLINFVAMYCCIVLLVHAITSLAFIDETTDYSTYLANCFNYTENMYSSATFGGVLSAIVVYPIFKTLTGWGLYALLILGLLITVFVATNFFMKYNSDLRESLFFEDAPVKNKIINQSLETTPKLTLKSTQEEDKDTQDVSFNSVFNKVETTIPLDTTNESKDDELNTSRTFNVGGASAYDILYGDINSATINPADKQTPQKPQSTFDTAPTVNLGVPTTNTTRATDTKPSIQEEREEDKKVPLTYSQSSPHPIRANPVGENYNTTPIINAEYIAKQKQLEEERKNNPVVEKVAVSTPVASTQQEEISEENDVFMEVDTSEFSDDISKPLISTVSPFVETKPQTKTVLENNDYLFETSNTSIDQSNVSNTPDTSFESKTVVVKEKIIDDSINAISSKEEKVEIEQEIKPAIINDEKINSTKESVEEKSQCDQSVLDEDDEIESEPVSSSSIRSAFDEPKTTHEEEEDELIIYPAYNAPKLDLLDSSPMVISVSQEEADRNKERIEATLEEFKIPAKVVNVVKGPTVTRYELEIGPGISVNRLPNLASDLAVRLSVEKVRWEIKDFIGLEVPNKTPSKVPINEVLSSSSFKSKEGDLVFAVGIDINGKKIVADVADMPHMLVAGGSGSGKSVALNSLIVSMLYRYSPEQLRFVMIDPKLVEFVVYEDLPHLMVNEIISDTEKIVSTFKWLINEMERRYKLLRNAGVVNIAQYNNVIDPRTVQRLPRIVVIVDELADIMSSPVKSEVELSIMRLAQKARAAGIHLILATQRPTVQVVSGNIKNNFGYRMALKVASQVDSKTILDTAGAEKLLGKGDMLFKLETSPDPIRLQGTYIDREEVNAVVNYIKENNDTFYSKSVENRILKPSSANLVGGIDLGEIERDKEFITALRICLDKNKASSSMIQSVMRIGWNKALRIMEAMEALGYVAPQEGSKPRQLLITREEFDKKYGGMA